MPPCWAKRPATFSKNAKSSANQKAGLENRPGVVFVEATNSHQMGMTK